MARSVKPAMRNAVATRARFRCEYCLRHEDDAIQSHHVDHIISEKHDGETALDNLAYSTDASSRMLIPLFNPRTDRWDEHFGLQFGEIVPLTSVGEATVRLLKLNAPQRIAEREWLTSHGRYPRT